jgi:hypothetical protein
VSDHAWKCLVCAQDTNVLNEYYMVHDHIWEAATPDPNGMLCIGCLAERLGRPLTRQDFTDAPVNHPGLSHSERLRLLLEQN